MVDRAAGDEDCCARIEWPAEERIHGSRLDQFTVQHQRGAGAERRADAAPGIEAAALAFGSDFVCLTTGRYDLVIAAEIWESEPARAFSRWLATGEAQSTIMDLGGYDTHATGQIEWVG